MKAITRDSNMELCRIVAMSMICIFHFFDHGIDEATKNAHLLLINLHNLLVYGSNIYFLISGYFLIKLSPRKLINFISIIFIFGLINYIALIFTGQHIHVNVFYILFFPISKSPYWFLQVYLLLMILSPLLNKGLDGLDIKSLRLQVAILSATVVYCCWIGDNISGNQHISLLRGIYYYILGYWLRHDQIIINKLSTISIICIIIISCFALYVLYNMKNDFDLLWYNYNSPLVIITGVSIFILFIKNKFKNHVINFIAGASLYVYMMQDGFFGFIYFYKWEQDFVNSHDIWQIITSFSTLFVAYWLLAIIAMVIMKKILAVENKFISRFIPHADKKIG